MLIIGHVQLARLDELGVREVLERHGALHGEIGRIDLQQQPGVVDGLVLVPHLARERLEVGLVRGVVRVHHGGGDDARRRRRHERLGERAAALRHGLEAGDLVLQRGDVEVLELALALRRVLLLADVREAVLQVVHELGKLLELAAAPALGYAAEAGHARGHVGLEADPLLLAVVADVDAGRLLLVHHVAHGPVHLGLEHGLVVGLAGLALDQQVGQHVVARQAADMRGQDSIAAMDHERSLRSGLRGRWPTGGCT